MKTILVVIFVVLQNIGEYTSFLDNISPDQLIDIKDNPDGTYTAFYRENEDEEIETDLQNGIAGD